MSELQDRLAGAEALAHLTDDQRATIAGCGHAATHAAGEYLLREGEVASAFFIIEAGVVALETFVPERGALTIETLHDGDLLGWSWLVPPYRVAFDARALTDTRSLHFEAACLRGKCEADPALGYALLKLFSAVILERLQSARVQLLDLYGSSLAEL